MKKKLILFVFIVVASCSRPVEFNKLDIDVSSYVESYERTNKTHFNFEFFVIKNPPGNYSKLYHIIDSFNTSTPFLPDSLYDYEYFRYFFKETRFTPKTFKEKGRQGYFSGTDDIWNHSKDMLLQQEWYKDGCVLHISHLFYKNGKHLDIKPDHIVLKRPCSEDSGKSDTSVH